MIINYNIKGVETEMEQKQFDLAFKYMKYKILSLFENEKYYERECKKIWLFLNKETKEFIKKEMVK